MKLALILPNSHRKFRSHLLGLTLGVFLLPSARLSADMASLPLGILQIEVAAGTGTGRALSGISVPLETPSQASGQVVGRITSLTPNTLTNSAAGWTAGQLSSAAAPTLIRFTSGAAKGRTFLVSTTSPNTSTTLTLDATDLGAVNLTNLEITTGENGDTYELLQGQTLAGLFGTDAGNGVLAGSDANLCDQVQLMVGGANRSYYLSNATSPQRWRRVGPNTVSNDTVIKPETGVNFSRLAASPLELTFLGAVPVLRRTVDVADGGSTTLSAGWAADTTLAGLGLPSLPTWTSGSVSIADTVQFLSGGAYRTYYHDGTNWRRVGPNSISNTAAIPAGTIYVVRQLGTATSIRPLTQIPPYSY